MRLRLVRSPCGVGAAAWHQSADRWLPLLDALTHPASAQLLLPDEREMMKLVALDMVAFLGFGPRAREVVHKLAERLGDESFPVDLTPRLPFAPRSLRPFLLSPRHSQQLARGMAARYLADGAQPTRPHQRVAAGQRPLMRRTPLSYQANHNALVPDGTAIDVPSYGHDLDYELEIGFIVSREVRDATAAECREAIGGLVILNDVSLRDTRWEEVQGNPLGPVQKCKSFATAMSSEVLTVDASADDLTWLTGSVDVDGERWATGRANDFVHTLPSCLARLREGETVLAGELLSTGTLANCSGIELGRLPPPGAEVRLTVEQIGSLTNRFGRAA